MNIPLLALAKRSLHEDTRAWIPHLSRIAFVVIMMFILLVFHDESLGRTGMGLVMLAAVMYLNLAFIGLAGVGAFAGVITEEKELQSLGLLKMTGLSPLSILLGKSIGPLYNALILLAIQMPFGFLALSFGGISMPQIIAAYVLLISVVLMVYSLALLCSVLCKRTVAASILLFVLLLAHHLGVFVLFLFVQIANEMRWYDPETMSQIMTFASWAFNSLAVVNMQTILFGAVPPYLVSFSAMVNFCIAGAAFALSLWDFNRSTRESQPAAPARIFARKTSVRRKQGRAWIDAMAWKEYRYFCGGGTGIFLYAVVQIFIATVLIALIGYVNGGGNFSLHQLRVEELGFVVVWISIIFLCMQIAAISSRVLQNDWRAKTLSSLALTPRSMGEIAYAKLWGASLQLLPTIGLIVIASWSFTDEWKEIMDVLFGEGAFVMIGLIFFGAHLAALYSLYLYRGALALAIATCAMGTFLFVATVNLLDASWGNDFEAILTFLGFMLIAAGFALHPLIGRRMRVLAASD